MTHNPPTNQLDLDAIETRANAATPGPWTIEYDYCDCSEYGCSHGKFAVSFGPFTSFENTTDRHHYDAEFAAHARTDVEQLVDEVRRLRAELITAKADTLGEVATELESIDFHPSAKSNCRALCRMLANRFRRNALEHLDAARPAVRPAVETGA